MQRLRLQPGGTHVVWLDERGEPAILWTFKDAIPALRGSASDMETGEVTRLDGRTPLRANSAYAFVK
jgi:hypothetical protein